MPTLYITDLDGTLLNENAVLSQKTIQTLKPMLASGLQLAVATARSPATAVELLAPLGLTLPAVLMTGAMVYDLQHTRALSTRHFSKQAEHEICAILEKAGQEALAYATLDGALNVYYKEFSSPLECHFVSTRLHSPYKTFVQCKNYHTALAPCDTLMFLLCLKDSQEAHAYYLLINAVEGVTCHFYVYEYGEGGYLLEVYPEGCNKATGMALANVKALAGADRVVCFGDNINDLPMFAACDVSCAVANACADAKAAATHIIGSNLQSSVAQWIEQDFKGAL